MKKMIAVVLAVFLMCTCAFASTNSIFGLSRATPRSLLYSGIITVSANGTWTSYKYSSRGSTGASIDVYTTNGVDSYVELWGSNSTTSAGSYIGEAYAGESQDSFYYEATECGGEAYLYYYFKVVNDNDTSAKIFVRLYD